MDGWTKTMEVNIRNDACLFYFLSTPLSQPAIDSNSQSHNSSRRHRINRKNRLLPACMSILVHVLIHVNCIPVTPGVAYHRQRSGLIASPGRWKPVPGEKPAEAAGKRCTVHAPVLVPVLGPSNPKASANLQTFFPSLPLPHPRTPHTHSLLIFASSTSALSPLSPSAQHCLARL